MNVEDKNAQQNAPKLTGTVNRACIAMRIILFGFGEC